MQSWYSNDYEALGKLGFEFIITCYKPSSVIGKLIVKYTIVKYVFVCGKIMICDLLAHAVAWENCLPSFPTQCGVVFLGEVGLQFENQLKVYDCHTCGKTFNRRTYLEQHTKIHGEKSYKCNLCDKAFRQRAGLWMHKKRKSCLKQSTFNNHSVSSISNLRTNDSGKDDRKRHKCEICNKFFSQKHLLKYHTRTHTGENPYPCPTCEKMFRGKASLRCHERTHTGYKPYECIFCKRAFTQLGSLRLHCRKKHGTEKIYKCEDCEEQFENFRELTAHRNRKTHLKSCGFEKGVPVPNVKREAGPSQGATEQSGDVKVINKAPLHPSVKICLVSHVEPETCAFANKVHSSSSQNNESDNFRFPNTPKKTIIETVVKTSTISTTCHLKEDNSCSSVNGEDSTPIHSKKMNTITETNFIGKDMPKSENNDSIYQCETCQKTFKRRIYLQLHEKIHGEKCYKCNVCDKGFCQPAGLWMHKKRQSCLKQNPDDDHTASNSNELNGEGLASSVSMKLKKITDTDVSSPKDQVLAKPEMEVNEHSRHCKSFSEDFSQAHTLKCNPETQSERNRHICVVCGKGFRTSGSLTVHQRIHNGKKPYKCIFCDQKFTQRNSLLEHCRRKHNTNQIYECSVCQEKFEKNKDLTSHKHVHSDVSYTMVKIGREELKPVESLVDDPIDFIPVMSTLNATGDLDSNKENDGKASLEDSSRLLYNRHGKNSMTRLNNICEEAGNVDISSDACVKRIIDDVDAEYIKSEEINQASTEQSCQNGHDQNGLSASHNAYKEIENTTISFSNECLLKSVGNDMTENPSSSDSGISRDTSPLDGYVECDEREDSIYEVSMQPIEMHPEQMDCTSNIWNTTPQIMSSITVEHSQTFTDDLDLLSNCARGSTLENGQRLDTCLENSLSHTNVSYEGSHGNHTVLKEDCFLTNSNDINLMHEFPSYSSDIPIHSDVFIDDDKIMYSDI